MNRRKLSWSDLPPDLLLTVAERLETQQDLLHFRAVCKKCRQSASFSLLPQKKLLSPLLPHKMSSPTPYLLNYSTSSIPSSEIPGNYLILVACSVSLLRSILNPELPPWLITVEELNPGKIYLRKPLSRIAIEDLPENFPRVLDLSHFHVIELGRLCTFRFGDNPKDMFQWKNWCYFNNRVVLALDPNCKTTPTIGDFIAMVLHGGGDLAAIKLKTEEIRIMGAISGVRKFDDIVNFKGTIYAVDRKGRAYEINYRFFWMSCVVKDPIGQGCSSERKKRLVVSCGELYLVYRYDRNFKCKFKIYKLNKEQKKWDEVKGIGDDRILFVTFDGCFFASVNDLPGWKGNCIVFYRGCFPTYRRSSSPDDDIFKAGVAELDIAVFHFEGGDCGL